MKKYIGKVSTALGILFFAGTVFLNGEDGKNSGISKVRAAGRNYEAVPVRQENGLAFFYEKAEEQGIAREEAAAFGKRLLADDILRDGSMEITGLVIEDMDGNGQTDLFIMLSSKGEENVYGSGCAWFYMNEDRPYCFAEEACSYDGFFDFFAEDIDNDGNVEMVLSTEGSGCGGAGDFYKAVFKFGSAGANPGIKRMELPSDLWDGCDDRGIVVSVYQEPGKNLYSAYCSYFQEIIYFGAENAFEPVEEAVWAGGNERGFFDLRPVKYQGKNALQASEYLYGEGGSSHEVATAQFIILWDEDGNGYVEKWWVENGVGNSKK